MWHGLDDLLDDEVDRIEFASGAKRCALLLRREASSIATDERLHRVVRMMAADYDWQLVADHLRFVAESIEEYGGPYQTPPKRGPGRYSLRRR